MLQVLRSPRWRARLGALLLALCPAIASGAPWQTLFDGKSLHGWQPLGGRAPFTVDNGELVGTSVAQAPNSFLATTRRYGDFILEFEVRVDASLNSGVQIRSQSHGAYKAGVVHGYQVEIDTSARAYSGGVYDESRRGWLYPLSRNDSGRRAFRPGEWNHYRVEAIGTRISTWVNGRQTARLVDDVDARGFIALQVHSVETPEQVGRQVRWRNIRIQTEGLENGAWPDDPQLDEISFLNGRLSAREASQGWHWLLEGQAEPGGEVLPDRAIQQPSAQFELQLEFKLRPGAEGGIRYGVGAGPGTPGAMAALEFQLRDDSSLPDAERRAQGAQTLGALRGLVAPANLSIPGRSKPFKGLDAWNHARIVVRDGRVAHWLNHERVVDHGLQGPASRALTAAAVAAVAAGQPGAIVFRNPNQGASFRNIKIREVPPAEPLSAVQEAKVAALIAAMTLEEKAGQMSQGDRRGKRYTAGVEAEIRQGRVGSFYNVADVTQRNAWQKLAVEGTRLGIPLVFGFDVVHGLRTIFPVPLAEAASWNLDLMARTARAAAQEARAMGIEWTFSPMVDISRDPRWGRVVEGAGEDPYLGALIARAKVSGYQGDDLSAPGAIAAGVKHFVAYGAPEAGREYNTAEVPERALRDIYLPPFLAAVEAGAATFMVGFNELDGLPVTAHKALLTGLLRQTWGFDGVIVSDWGSVEQLVDHGLARDAAEAGSLAAHAGVDMEMVSQSYIDHLPRLVRQGAFPESVLDSAVRRILRLKFKLGLFDRPYVDPALQHQVLLSPEHRRLARQAARESMVLLKNAGPLLPLARRPQKIALIGPLADHRKGMLGTWSTAARPEDAVTLLEGLQAGAGPGTELLHASGCDAACNSSGGFAAAVALARQADVVLLAVGETDVHNGESHSRAQLGLPGLQDDLVQAIQQTGKPVVVVLLAGRPLTLSRLLDTVPSVLLAWHPGVEGGHAITDVLFGDHNPAGKLTMTFPKAVGQIPIYYNHKPTGRASLARHIDLDATPLLPFGHGLSYTRFGYSQLHIEQARVAIPGTLRVSAAITNTGTRAGHEVVQLYVRDVAASVTRPVKELKGFERIFLQPGETRTVHFHVPTDRLKFTDAEMQHVVEPGEFKVWIGPSSASGLQGSFELH